MIDRTTMAFRSVALLLELGTTLMATLVVLGNVTDPRSNLQFVEHILSMDTTYRTRALMWRALPQRIMHRLAFGIIVAFEIAVMVIGWIGAVQLITHLDAPAAQWHDAKFWAVVALGIAAFIWFFMFQVIGNEWFASWQSETWNGAQDSTRINVVTFAGLLLLLLTS